MSIDKKATYPFHIQLWIHNHRGPQYSKIISMYIYIFFFLLFWLAISHTHSRVHAGSSDHFLSTHVIFFPLLQVRNVRNTALLIPFPLVAPRRLHLECRDGKYYRRRTPVYNSAAASTVLSDTLHALDKGTSNLDHTRREQRPK